MVGREVHKHCLVNPRRKKLQTGRSREHGSQGPSAKSSNVDQLAFQQQLIETLLSDQVFLNATYWQSRNLENLLFGW